jgi:O-glycosyl hydrolase
MASPLDERGTPAPLGRGVSENEPSASTAYSSNTYTSAQYYEAFKVIAPKIHVAYPTIYIHANSEGGQNGVGGANIRADSSTLALVNGWSWHKIGDNSNDQISTNYTTNAMGKDVFNDEFEYLDGSTSLERMINTAQSIMNWMTFQGSPTWFWLHALKRTNDTVAQGYGLGIWRPADDTDFSHYPNIQPGSWDYLPYNWDAVAGFVRYMPENSVRYQVDESTVLQNNRIMAWKTPSGKLVVALTSRNTNNFTFTINLGGSRTMAGYEFNGTLNSVSRGTQTGGTLATTLAPDTIQFWVEQ